MKIKLLRHATMLLYMNGLKFLVDPVFSPAGAMATVANSANDALNPLVELPVEAEELLNVDAVIVTHTHRDHFDDEAARLLPKQVQIFCQPEDEEKLLARGFKEVAAVDGSCVWRGITITRTGGRHGSGENAVMLAPVSGFVLQAAEEPTLYIAGDTIWCEQVEDALKRFNPAVTVVFAGAAQFLTGGPITMSEGDIYKVCRACPGTKLFVVHMEAWNHCLLTRFQLNTCIQSNGLGAQVFVPEDGQGMEF